MVDLFPKGIRLYGPTESYLAPRPASGGDEISRYTGQPRDVDSAPLEP